MAWGKFIQTGTFDSHARFETRFCHTGSTNTCSLWFVDTFDKSQTNIQRSYLCDFMNIKENILFLRNEWTTGEFDKSDILLYDVTQGNTSAFDRKLSSSKARKIVIIIKEEGSEEETKQEEADVKTKTKNKKQNVNNGYTDLKRHHQNAKIRKIFNWANRGKHWTSKQTRSANSIRFLLFVQPTLFYFIFYFFAKQIAKLPK